jgi:hypothetical protein
MPPSGLVGASSIGGMGNLSSAAGVAWGTPGGATNGSERFDRATAAQHHSTRESGRLSGNWSLALSLYGGGFVPSSRVESVRMLAEELRSFSHTRKIISAAVMLGSHDSQGSFGGHSASTTGRRVSSTARSVPGHGQGQGQGYGHGGGYGHTPSTASASHMSSSVPSSPSKMDSSFSSNYGDAIVVYEGTPASGTLGGPGSCVGVGKSEVLEELRNVVLNNTVVDKNEFSKMLDNSRVMRRDVSFGLFSPEN